MTLRTHTHTHTHTIAISDRFRNRTTIIYSKWVCGLPCLSQGLASSSWSTAFKKEYSSDRPIGINRPILAGKYSKDTSIRQQFGTTESRAKGRCWAFQYVQSFYLLGGTRKRWSHKPMIWDIDLYILCISDIFDTSILKTYLFFIGFTGLPYWFAMFACFCLPSRLLFMDRILLFGLTFLWHNHHNTHHSQCFKACLNSRITSPSTQHEMIYSI